MSKKLKLFKESSPNGKITLCLRSRHLSPSSLMDGIILVDQNHVPTGRRIWAEFSGERRIPYDEYATIVESGRSTRFFNATKQFYPRPGVTDNSNLTEFQRALIEQSESEAVPFSFDVPSQLPPSVVLISRPRGAEPFAGVRYLVKIHCGEVGTDLTDKESEVCVEVCIIGPKTGGDRQPSVKARKSPTFGRGLIKLEVNLEKELFYHGEEVPVHICLNNTSGLEVKKIKAWIDQILEIPRAALERRRSCTIDAYQKELSRSVAQITIPLKLELEELGPRVAVNGPLVYGMTELASTTSRRYDEGIFVNYRVVVKVCFRGWHKSLITELPFVIGQSGALDGCLYQIKLH